MRDFNRIIKKTLHLLRRKGYGIDDEVQSLVHMSIVYALREDAIDDFDAYVFKLAEHAVSRYYATIKIRREVSLLDFDYAERFSYRRDDAQRILNTMDEPDRSIGNAVWIEHRSIVDVAKVYHMQPVDLAWRLSQLAELIRDALADI